MIGIQPVPGEPLRYRVPSDTLGKPSHLVDLTSLNGNGICDCEDFQIRRRPALRNGEPMSNAKTRCKHLRKARQFLADQVIRKYLEKQREHRKATGGYHAPHNQE